MMRWYQKARLNSRCGGGGCGLKHKRDLGEGEFGSGDEPHGEHKHKRLVSCNFH